MNLKKFPMRRLVTILMLLVVLICGGVFGLYMMRVNIPLLNTPKVYAYLDSRGMSERTNQVKEYIVKQYESFFHKKEAGESHEEQNQIVVTKPKAKDITIKQIYVCQIHSKRHIDICALEDGYLMPILLKEGQAVKEGEVMFEVNPILYKTRWDAEVAERDLAQLELNYSVQLAKSKGVSQNEVPLFQAKLAKVQARVAQAEAEYNFTRIKAPFDGIIDRFKKQQGTLVKEGDILTTLSDNSVMWVYFNVPEKRYLEYMAETGQNKQSTEIELILASHSKYEYNGKIDPANNIGAIEAQFNPETGNIAFRADFPNPIGPAGRLLRHGQTGTVLISRALRGAIIIPQRATFEILDKRYVYVVDKDGVAHQREIIIQNEIDDIFVVGKGLDVNDMFVLQGVRQVRDGETLKYEEITPDKALENLKFHAE